MSELSLREADKMEVTVVVDNYTDVLLSDSTKVVKRQPAAPPGAAPLAEHGLSCLIKVYAGSEEHAMLMDAGRSSICLFHNIEVLEIDLSKIECMLLSHGHRDHFGGLLELSRRLKKGTPITLHPDAFLPRRIKIPDVGVRDMPGLDETALRQTGVALNKVRKASPLCSDLVLALGEVERVTDFEKGFPWAEAKINGAWALDPFYDDQGLAVKLKSQGLVVLGGCSHAGIINTVKHAQKVTRTDKVHAVLGGFHLTGPIFEPIIAPTIKEMKKIGPNFVVPMHCTGWKAINEFSKEMPGQFVLNTVGTTYVFE